MQLADLENQPCPNHPAATVTAKHIGRRLIFRCSNPEHACNTEALTASLAQKQTNGHTESVAPTTAALVEAVEGSPPAVSAAPPPSDVIPWRDSKPSPDWLARVPPHNADAEMCVLGAVLVQPQTIESIVPFLKVDDFYQEKNRIIYAAMVDLHRTATPIDVVTLQTLIGKQDLKRIGGPSYLVEVATYVPTAANIKAYAEMIRDTAIKREVIDKANHLMALAYDGVTADALIGEVERVLTPVKTAGAS